MASNTTIDYSKQDELNNSRMKPPSADNFHVPQNGRADSYLQNSTADNYGESGYENAHAERLNRARAGSETSQAKAQNLAGDVAATTTPRGTFSLLKQVNPIGDMPFVAAIIASVFKDLLDLATFETVILPFIFSSLCGIFIFMMLLLVGATGKKKMANGLLKKGGIILGATLVGFIPGLNIFPEATIGTLGAWMMTLSERKHSK